MKKEKEKKERKKGKAPSVRIRVHRRASHVLPYHEEKKVEIRGAEGEGERVITYGDT